VSDQDWVQDAGGGGDAEHRYDPKLAARILAAIEDYNRENQIVPSPAPLRDTMLAVAALLHLDAARASPAKSVLLADDVVFDGFAEAAREQMRAVTDARSATSGCKQ
jgi:hypothetical protein